MPDLSPDAPNVCRVVQKHASVIAGDRGDSVPVFQDGQHRLLHLACHPGYSSRVGTSLDPQEGTQRFDQDHDKLYVLLSESERNPPRGWSDEPVRERPRLQFPDVLQRIRVCVARGVEYPCGSSDLFAM